MTFLAEAPLLLVQNGGHLNATLAKFEVTGWCVEL